METIQINGVPVSFTTNADGFYLTATNQSVNLTGSPLNVSFGNGVAPSVGVAQVTQILTDAGIGV